MTDITAWVTAAEGAVTRIEKKGDFKVWLKNNQPALDRIRDATPDRLKLLDQLMERFG